MNAFFGQNFRFSARKSIFFHRTPDFVNGSFIALGETVDLAPRIDFLTFCFRVTAVFVKKTGQCAKSLPSPHYGVRRLDDRRDYLGANLESMKLTDTIARSADRKCQFFQLFFLFGWFGK